jgi:hypothetical protein
MISLQEIKDENQKLRNELNARCGKDLVDSMILSRVGAPNEKFSAALKKRENCSVSASTLAMLQAMAREAMSKIKPS